MTESSLYLCGKLVHSSTRKDFKIDVNGARAFIALFLCGVDSNVVKAVTFETKTWFG